MPMRLGLTCPSLPPSFPPLCVLLLLYARSPSGVMVNAHRSWSTLDCEWLGSAIEIRATRPPRCAPPPPPCCCWHRLLAPTSMCVHGGRQGGALVIGAGNATLTDCSFTSNSASVGQKLAAPCCMLLGAAGLVVSALLHLFPLDQLSWPQHSPRAATTVPLLLLIGPGSRLITACHSMYADTYRWWCIPLAGGLTVALCCCCPVPVSPRVSPPRGVTGNSL